MSRADESDLRDGDELFAPDYRDQVTRLIQRLSEAEGALQAMAAGELDAVVDPASAAPILLSRAQDALARSESRHRDLVERCPALVCEFAPDGRTLFLNAAVSALLGYDRDTLAGQRFWETLAPPDHRGGVEVLLRRLRRGDVAGHELPLVARGGAVKWIEWTSANRYAPDGELLEIVAFGLDVTERKHAEDAARRLEAERVARAGAEAANKAKTDFLAVMSHELRTPLNAIGGYVELIELGIRGPVSAQQLEDLGKIRRSQRHLLGLINDIMNFARLETGHVRFDYADVAVNETLAVLDALTGPIARTRGITVRYGRCDPNLTVWADREKLRQILVNLVTNAIKFTDAGGRVGVECEEHATDVHFIVHDTGRGIASDKLESIFEPFVQVNQQLTRAHEGVGLGLAISRDLAREMGGELTAQSTPGVGSRFTLVLRRAAPPRP
jgi:PAS domain S-box-containing protein